MNSPPDVVYALVRDTDPDVLDTDGLAAYTRQVAQLKAWCEARQVRATRRQRELSSQGRATDPRHSLSRDGRQSSKDARAASERESVCTSMPGFEEARSDGAVSAGHVDAVAAATRTLDEAAAAEFAAEAESLVADATSHGVDTFARNCRDLARSIADRQNAHSDIDELDRQRQASKIGRWVDRETGLHKTLIELDPVSDRQFWAVVQHARGALRSRTQNRTTSWDRLTVDALLEALGTSADGSRRVPSLVVHVDVRTLTGGRHASTLCEIDSAAPVPVDTMRRIACDADVIPVVLSGEGVVLDQGRAKRLATAQQRRAIEAMQRTCSHPDCTVTIDDCRIHHLDPWNRGGRTDLERLAPLCEQHHHLVHEGGWSFEMTQARIGTWIRPDGETYWSGSLNDRLVASI
ncbi:MAG: HNH endonuclease [Ilumatobacteraceae bacterium]